MKRRFTSLPLPQQAALLCRDAQFQQFLSEELASDCRDETAATECLRLICDVQSRAELRPDNSAGQKFISKRDKYIAWKLVA